MAKNSKRNGRSVESPGRDPAVQDSTSPLETQQSVEAEVQANLEETAVADDSTQGKRSLSEPVPATLQSAAQLNSVTDTTAAIVIQLLPVRQRIIRALCTLTPMSQTVGPGSFLFTDKGQWLLLGVGEDRIPGMSEHTFCVLLRFIAGEPDIHAGSKLRTTQ